MSFFTRNGFLSVANPFMQVKRYRGKINIQKPRPPHFERAKYLALATPFYRKGTKYVCDKDVNYFKRFEVENPFQRLLANELIERLQTSRLVAFYHMNSMTIDQHHKAEVLFYRENMKYKNYGRKTLEKAVEGTPYEAILEFYISHNMIVFSPELKIKELLKVSKRLSTLILIAAIVDGKLVNVEELQQLSLIPNLQAAQSQLVHTLNSIGGQVVSQLTTHQNTLVSQLQERIKQLEEK